MKLKLSDIVGAVISLRTLGAEKMPIRLAYNIQRNIRLLAVEAATYERMRQDLVKHKYGEETEDKSFKVPDEKMDDFVAEMNKLGEEEVELDVHTVNFADLADIKVSPNTLQGLEWMFVDGEQEKT
jgi:hypothetical protein